ncbi:M56 family metallopeptidase [Thalassotalea profundi]|uniref:Peptidase M56 domain-containing protein n=1 Tax=Thalassotalea profundi TaxID=2036687 RepID=A0ABQ3ISF4_9GAMM|nr:M56 family metallopeptidase [Thalassotalea profundi]GHE91555.1 hypothetical protein GCM10011501_21170 [Thalassotalea profundi]
MESYFYANIAISTLVLVLIKYGKGSNNANYYLTLAAIIAWFIPYSLIAQLIPDQVLAEPTIISLSKVNSIIVNDDVSKSIINIGVFVKWLLWSLLSVGILIFAKQMIQIISCQRRIMAEPSLAYSSELSDKHKVNIFSLNQDNSGFILGIFNPVVIISDKLLESQFLDLIIAHEKQHIKSYDNLRLFLLEFCGCVFWWNPWVLKLISVNRFLIEARCDEKASKTFGVHQYIKDLSSLLLLNHYRHHQRDINNVMCSVISSEKHNITRIKLLKESRKMTIRTKILYSVITLSTLTMMSWNTIATAINNDKHEAQQTEMKRLGALMNFDITVIDRTAINGMVRETSSNIVLWVDFDKKAEFMIHDKFKFNLNVKDLEELAFVEIELIEINKSAENTVATPRLAVNYSKEAMIEIDNPDISINAYAIKFTPLKTTNPEA